MFGGSCRIDCGVTTVCASRVRTMWRSRSTWASSAGVAIPALARDLQQRIAEYLERMTGTTPAAVDVVVHEVGG